MLYRAIFKYLGEDRKVTVEDRLNHFDIHDEVTRNQMNESLNSIFKVIKVTWLINRKDKYGQLMLTTNRELTNHDIFLIHDWFKANFNAEDIDSDFIFEREDYVSEVAS